ncbi:WYL domain-containing protein [Desulfovibrio sp. OttesenSCG-928-G11]|nr:WYL domain-containing protein [Desulfovibrio sp. OttesenSCG-928-G11]
MPKKIEAVEQLTRQIMPTNPTEIPSSIKLLSLYELLAFSGRAYSLSQLREKTGYSRQTILRLVEQLDRYSSLGKIESWKEGRERYFRLSLSKRPAVSMADEDIRVLALCRDIAAGILPSGHEKVADSSLAKTASAFLADMQQREEALAQIIQTRSMGCVDYSAFQGIIDSLRQCIRDKNVCLLEYHKLKASEKKFYEVGFVGLQRYADSLYAIGWLVKEKGSPEAVRQATFAVQRIISVSPTRRKHSLTLPDADSFQLFGFPRNEAEKIRVHFTRGVDQYIRERYWSKEQHIEELDDGSIILTFYSQSQEEVFAKIMSFGIEATVLEPESLKERIRVEAQILSKR